MNADETYSYTDPTDAFGHTLHVTAVTASTYDGDLPVVALAITVPEDATDPGNPVVYVPLDDVAGVLNAIGSAAGTSVPETPVTHYPDPAEAYGGLVQTLREELPPTDAEDAVRTLDDLRRLDRAAGRAAGLRDAEAELLRIADEVEVRVAAHYGAASGLGPGTCELVRESARVVGQMTVAEQAPAPQCACGGQTLLEVHSVERRYDPVPQPQTAPERDDTADARRAVARFIRPGTGIAYNPAPAPQAKTAPDADPHWRMDGGLPKRTFAGLLAAQGNVQPETAPDAEPGTPDLRQAIDDAIRPTMLVGLQDAELDGPGGAQRIGDWVTWIADTVATELAPAPAQDGDPR